MLIGATLALFGGVQARADDRPDIYSFTAAQRMDLFDQMSNYIDAAIVLQHLDPPADKHGSSRFLVWHRASRHRYAMQYGWWALNSGERRTAAVYGAKAVMAKPVRPGGWKLLAKAAMTRRPQVAEVAR